MSTIYWFTGQPGHGKTTLAKALKKHIEEKYKTTVFHIDGDDLRALNKNQNYTPEGRIENMVTAQRIAHFLSNKGHHVVVALVSPYKEIRDAFKKKTGCKEIYVFTTEKRGKEENHTSEYEPPEEDYLHIDTTNKTVEESLSNIIDILKP